MTEARKGFVIAGSRRASAVLASNDPAIHAEGHFSMDHRVKPGGDEAREPGGVV